MSLLANILQFLGLFAINIISSLGYFGILFLMALESMIFPMPAELVMPFAGFLAYQGKFSFLLVMIFSSIGSIVGSLISYYIGFYLGDKFIIRYGKYFLLSVDDLRKTERWFNEKGDYTILISRFIPVVRHIISIPAGIGKMNKLKFCFYTFVGSTTYNFVLAYLGYLLGKNWNLVRQYSEPLSIIIALVLVILIIYFVFSHVKGKIKNS